MRLSETILAFITLFLDNPSLCYANTTIFLFAFTFLLDLIIFLPVGLFSSITGHTVSSSFRNLEISQPPHPLIIMGALLGTPPICLFLTD